MHLTSSLCSRRESTAIEFGPACNRTEAEPPKRSGTAAGAPCSAAEAKGKIVRAGETSKVVWFKGALEGNPGILKFPWRTSVSTCIEPGRSAFGLVSFARMRRLRPSRPRCTRLEDFSTASDGWTRYWHEQNLELAAKPLWMTGPCDAELVSFRP